jgi:hypothetical protein
MTTETEEENGGSRVINCSPLDIRIARPLIKDLSEYPVPCRNCADTHYIFHMPGHPDDGTWMSCGIMVENKNAGCMIFTCSHFRTEPNVFTVVTRESDKLICKTNGKTCLCDPDYNSCGKTIAAIIDADAVQEQARAQRIVEEMSARMTRAVQRPIIIAPPEPSPHAFLDDAIAKINEDQRVIKSVLNEEDKKGCFGAYNYHGCVLPCVWSDRCQQSQEDY